MEQTAEVMSVTEPITAQVVVDAATMQGINDRLEDIDFKMGLFQSFEEEEEDDDAER